MSGQYVIVFSKNFIEIWNVKKANLRQMMFCPKLQIADASQNLFTMSDGENLEFVISTVKLEDELKE
jgi:hypothetical protein